MTALAFYYNAKPATGPFEGQMTNRTAANRPSALSGGIFSALGIELVIDEVENAIG